MKAPECTVCGGWTNRYSEQWPSLWLCDYCITLTLRGLHTLDPMILHNNPFVYELMHQHKTGHQVPMHFQVEVIPGETYKTFHVRFDRLIAPPMVDEPSESELPTDFALDNL